MSDGAPASAALRSLRRAAGLSQEQLAHLCGVSERTIRVLESGRVGRPHQDTLHAIAAALQLGPAERTNFVAAWRSRPRPLHDLVSGPSPEIALRTEFERQRSLLREISVSERVRVDAERRWASSTVRRTFEVVGHGLQRLLWARSFLPDLVDGARLEVVDCVNVEVEDVVVIPEWNARAWQGSFRGELTPGELYSLEYTIDYGAAHLPGASLAEPDTVALTGLLAAVRSVYTEVQFDPDHLPVRVWSVRQATVDGPEEHVHDLEVSRFGIVQSLVEPAASGAHGVRWEWTGSS